MNRAEGIFHRFYDELSRTASGKQAMAGALILTADTLIDQWIFKDHIRLTPDQLAPYLKGDSDIDTNVNALRDIYEWIYAHEDGFQESSGFRLGKTLNRRTGDKYWAIRYSEFISLLNRLGYNYDSFVAWAFENNLLYVNGNATRNERTRSVTMAHGHTARCVCIIYEQNSESLSDDQ